MFRALTLSGSLAWHSVLPLRCNNDRSTCKIGNFHKTTEYTINPVIKAISFFLLLLFRFGSWAFVCDEDFPLAYINRIWVNKPRDILCTFFRQKLCIQISKQIKLCNFLNSTFPLFSVFSLILYLFSIFRLTTPLNAGPQQMSQNDVVGPHCQIGGNSPLVMPGFPLRTSHSVHTPHYSPYSPSR